MPDAPWTADDVSRMLCNPFYAITLDPNLFGDHEPLVSKDEWVRANVRMIKELGPEAYVRQMLEILEGNYPKNDEA